MHIKITQQCQLLNAIQDNDLDAAEDLLRANVDPDTRFVLGSSNQVPAICLCVERGLYEMTKLLIDFGCSINQVDSFGYTPLHLASSHQFYDLVRLLITHRANLNAVSNYGHTALHLASQQSSVEIVRCLVEGGSTLEKKDRDGRTALALARAIAKYLVKAGADVNSSDNCANSPLLHAVNSGLALNYELISLLLSGGANPNHSNKYGQTALITAVRRGSEHSLDGLLTVKDLIDNGCNLNEKDPGSFGESVLHVSISRGQDRITEELIRSGSDINDRNQRGFSPLHRLAREGKTDLVKLLIAAGADTHLPKQFFVDEAGQIREISDPEISGLLKSRTGRIASLKHLSRISLRRWLERRADQVIKRLNLPSSLRQYLLLLEL